MTTSVPSVKQPRAADSSKIQGETTKDCTLQDESTNQREVVPVDNGGPMDVQSSGGPVIRAKRGPPVIVNKMSSHRSNHRKR
ncbi:hypothetical protein MRX96_024974 [Rhipicephalus microplus]